MLSRLRGGASCAFSADADGSNWMYINEAYSLFFIAIRSKMPKTLKAKEIGDCKIPVFPGLIGLLAILYRLILRPLKRACGLALNGSNPATYRHFMPLTPYALLRAKKPCPSPRR